jgi:hypothetical protein
VKHATAAHGDLWLFSSRSWLRSHVPDIERRCPYFVHELHKQRSLGFVHPKGRLLLPRSPAADFGRISLVLRPSPGATGISRRSTGPSCLFWKGLLFSYYRRSRSSAARPPKNGVVLPAPCRFYQRGSSLTFFFYPPAPRLRPRPVWIARPVRAHC